MRSTTPFVIFDPRSKMATVILASLLLTFRVEWEIEMAFVIIMFLLLSLNGGFKKGLFLSLVYIAMHVCEHFLFSEITGPITAFVSFILAVIQLLIPPIMAATFCMNQTKMSQWIAAMKQMHLPMFIVIPFSVVCRFFPVLIQDFRQIKKTMKFRGIGLNSIDVITHPFLTLEYILVPLLSSVEITSIDLSAAALVRGLGNENKHTSIYDNRLKLQDYLLLLLILLFLCWEGSYWL